MATTGPHLFVQLHEPVPPRQEGVPVDLLLSLQIAHVPIVGIEVVARLLVDEAVSGLEDVIRNQLERLPRLERASLHLTTDLVIPIGPDGEDDALAYGGDDEGGVGRGVDAGVREELA